MSAHHTPAATDYLHDSAETTEARTPTDQQQRVLELLNYPTGPRVRLSLDDWGRVERVTAALNP